MGEPDQPSAAGEPTLPRLSEERLRFLAMDAHGRGSAIANSDAGAVYWASPTRGQVHAVGKEAEERSLATECLESRERIANFEKLIRDLHEQNEDLRDAHRGAHDRCVAAEAKLAALEGEARVDTSDHVSIDAVLWKVQTLLDDAGKLRHEAEIREQAIGEAMKVIARMAHQALAPKEAPHG